MLTTTIPALVFAFVISMLCGALYHFVRGGGGWHLLFYFGMSALGFAIGQSMSVWRGWVLMRFGVLDVGLGVLGSFLLLMLGEWLSRIDINGNDESGV